MRCILAGAALLIGVSAAAQETREDVVDKAAFQALCSTCHATTLVEGLRTESEWREEVEQMVKIGAKGTDAQFTRVLRFLERTLTKVNVNTATAAQIAPVLDIGDAAAVALVKKRIEGGKFASLDDLKKVAGIDAAKLNARKDRILFR